MIIDPCYPCSSGRQLGVLPRRLRLLSEPGPAGAIRHARRLLHQPGAASGDDLPQPEDRPELQHRLRQQDHHGGRLSYQVPTYATKSYKYCFTNICDNRYL
jgi:hypothetical protein